MEKKSIKKNYVYNLCYQIFLLLTPLITTPYVSRVLGAKVIGTVSYIDSVVAYFILFANMGITTYGQREISYVQNSREKMSFVFWNTKIFQFIIDFIVILVYFIFVSFQKHSVIYGVYSLNIFAVFMDITWFFQGIEEFEKIILRNIIFKITNIIYIFIFIKSSDDIIVYVFGICFFALLSNISLWFYLPKYIDKINWKRLYPLKNIKTVISLFIPTIAIQIYTVLDKTMIGIITQNSYENGFYEQALKISKMVLIVVTSLGTVMIPRIGYYFEQKNIEEIRRLMYRGYRFVWLLGVPLCLGLIVVSPNFVPWFFGKGYEKVIDLIQILAFLILSIGINNVTGMQYLIPTKKQKIFTITVIIGAFTNFILNIILIRYYLSIGAAIASVVAESTIAVVQLIMVKRELNILIILKEGIHYFIAGVIMAMGLLFLSKNFVSSMLNTIIMVLIGTTIYIFILILLRDEFFLTNIKLILNKLFRKVKKNNV